ncbi:hypothetical protein HU200_018577 [Digitaria exilis]|uniref:Uncharacterized protein n=1 Tax=Digitaria exilis TaxID=1010633 RepID=A0A835F4D3_9POAL|nr:hypothetical protein HU200_018577 [Digitaria exilis]
MDGGGVVQEDGEASPAPPVDVGDLVTLKSAGEHGDRGIVVYMDDDMPEDKVPVLYVGGAVAHAELGDLAVVDRSSLCSGQLVVSASDPGGQFGVVVGVETKLDLVGFEGSGVLLRRVTDLGEGDYVSSGSWLGRVVGLSVEVDVLFDDGAACRVTAPEKKLWTAGVGNDVVILRTAKNGFFYPGERVVGADASVFQAATWPRGGHRRQGGAGLRARELGGGEAPWRQAHPRNPRDLTFVRSDYQGYWGVADRCFFRDPGRHGPTAGDDKVVRHAAFERPMSVVGTRTTADVLRQDGTWQRGVPSASLDPFETHVGQFFPGDRVVIAFAGADDDDDAAAPARSGVVRSLDYKDQTARVSWLRPARGGEEERSETVTVSAYHLESAHGHVAFYGDVVPAATAHRRIQAVAAMVTDLSWIGHVADLCDGDAYIQVKGSDRNTRVPAKEMNGEASSTGDGQETEVVSAPANCGGEGTDGDGSDEDWKAGADDVDSGDDDDSSHFTQFDVVQQTPLDHHFLDEVEQTPSTFGRSRTGWTYSGRRWWRAAGTPYQDGLFFFDVQLPASYPEAPPRVYYHSFGQLGTPGGARIALPALRRERLPARAPDHAAPAPPEGLAGRGSRSSLVLRACEAYLLQGCAVGTLDADACATAESRERRPCSAGLRIALAAVVPRLVEAFTEIGADGCEHFDRLRLQRAVQVMVECLPRCI